MPVIAVKVGDYLTREQVLQLRGRSDLVGVLLVLHAWALIAGSMVLFAWWPNPFTFLLSVMVIGGRQLGLAILMHDAAHGLLFAGRRLNDRVGSWLCAYPVFASLALYRPYHLQHHRFTQQPEDPDLGLSAAFPISRRSLQRKILRDLTGQTAYLRRGEQIRRALGPSEHAVVPDNDDPLRNTRTTYANPVVRLLPAPQWVNFHLEHHLFMFVPCWRLPVAHRALLAGSRGRPMELETGYLEVLRAATSGLADTPRGAGGRGTTQHI